MNYPLILDYGTIRPGSAGLEIACGFHPAVLSKYANIQNQQLTPFTVRFPGWFPGFKTASCYQPLFETGNYQGTHWYLPENIIPDGSVFWGGAHIPVGQKRQ